MQRLLIIALLLLACRRQPGLLTGWGIGSDGEAANDRGGRSDGVAPDAPDGSAGGLMGQALPPREFAPDAQADSRDAGLKSAAPSADASGDADVDARGDARVCPETGHCD